MWVTFHSISSGASLTFGPFMEDLCKDEGNGFWFFVVSLEDLKLGGNNIKQIAIRAGHNWVRTDVD